MAYIVVIERNPLLRLGILHILSTKNVATHFASYDPAEIYQITFDDPCDLVIMSVSDADNVESISKDIERIFKPPSILLLSDTASVPLPSGHTSALIAGCICRHAAPEILQASTQLVLAGGRCFPATPCVSQRKDDLLLPYRPEKWPPAEPACPTSSAAEGPPSATLAELTPIAEPLSKRYSRPTTMYESQMLGLTPRQYEVLVLLARGYPMKLVGRYLNISVATAKAHTEALYQRLDVKNRNAAVYTAISRGATLGWNTTPAFQGERAHSA